jgi:Tfp pilus assembly protein PilN
VKRLPIDFAPRTGFSLWSRLPVFAIPLSLFALVAIAAACLQLILVQRQISNLEKASEVALESASAQNARIKLTDPLRITPAQAASVNSAIRKLNVPWEEILDAIEGAGMPKVALLELRHDVSSRQIVAVAEAANSDAMFAYMRKLQVQPMLTAVYLSNHQVSELDKNKPVRFEFSAKWREMPL